MQKQSQPSRVDLGLLVCALFRNLTLMLVFPVDSQIYTQIKVTLNRVELKSMIMKTYPDSSIEVKVFSRCESFKEDVKLWAYTSHSADYLHVISVSIIKMHNEGINTYCWFR